MRAFRILGRNIRDSFKSVFRNFSLSLASISCITITLVLVAVAVVLSYNINNFTKEVERTLTIVVFLDRDTTLKQADEIETKINQLDNVESVIFNDKMNIAEDLMESSEDYKLVLSKYDSRDTMPLSDTFHVKATSIEKMDELAKQIEEIDKVMSVKYGEGTIDQLISTFKIIKNVSVVTVAGLILVTAFLISNTIKITIFSRKREIEIMRLVGASNVNIKLPFIFEGLFLGLIGSVIPVLATTYGYVALYKNFNGQAFNSPFIKLIIPEPFIYYVSFILIGIGVFVGMIGSARAVRKYLKI